MSGGLCQEKSDINGGGIFLFSPKTCLCVLSYVSLPQAAAFGCSQMSVSMALQPAQAQLPEAFVCQADTPWVCQILLTDTGTDLAQAGQATGTWPRGRS